MSINCYALKLLFCLVFISSVLQLCMAANVPASNDQDKDYWRKRKDWFYKRTKFDLTDDNLKLLGPKRLLMNNKLDLPQGHLPFWFDYELFKKVFHKSSASDDNEERARHNNYISTCMRVFKARTLFRMLAGTSDTFITNDADKFHWEIFGPIEDDQSDEKNEISFTISSRIDELSSEPEAPLDRAARLMKQEMDIVESKNQVETYLKAFNEVDGSAIKANMPY